MFRMGLTGGIAAGKSVVARRLAQLGAVVIDHDVLAREAVAPGSMGLAGLVKEFGQHIVGDNGVLDRARLGSIVFADDGARARLNRIVHPHVRRLAWEYEALETRRNPEAVVVHEIPLLVETGQADSFQLLAVVQAPQSQRLQRLVDGRGMDAAEARGRIAAQASEEDRISVADVVLDGSGTKEHLREQVDALWEQVQVHCQSGALR